MHVFVIHVACSDLLAALVNLGQNLLLPLLDFVTGKKATGKNGALSRHANSVAHKEAEVAWHQYQRNLQHCTSISDRINSARSVTITQN